MSMLRFSRSDVRACEVYITGAVFAFFIALDTRYRRVYPIEPSVVGDIGECLYIIIGKHKSSFHGAYRDNYT